MSISKAQAQALAESFLENVGGNDPDGLLPRTSLTELIQLAGELVEDAQDNLNQKSNNASGGLSESFVIEEPEVVGDAMQVDILMNHYGKFQNKGVKGTRSGGSKAGYFFKNEFPSQKMVKAISEYMKRADMSVRSVKKYSAYGNIEKKNKSLSELSGAYGMARSIKMKGIEPTGFLDNAVQKTEDKIAERLGEALRIDVINSI